MPLGIVSDDEFEDSLNDESEQVRASIVNKTSSGRAVGDNNVPDSLRRIIGEDASINGSKNTIEAIARPLGISTSSVSAYKNGATSTASYNDKAPDLLSHINKGKTEVIKRATRTMKRALINITEEKLNGAKAKDLAGIAKDMSAMIKNLEPEEQKEKNVQFVFFAPRTRAIDTYDVLDVSNE